MMALRKKPSKASCIHFPESSLLHCSEHTRPPSSSQEEQRKILLLQGFQEQFT
tara:strand:- start:104 stop:262 length:159 start_codon:yes stop_codon:yes gene_type:complete